MKPQSPLYETLLHFRKFDQEGFKRFVIAFEAYYRIRLDDWVKEKDVSCLPKLQGAALAYQDLLELLKHIQAAS